MNSNLSWLLPTEVDYAINDPSLGDLACEASRAYHNFQVLLKSRTTHDLQFDLWRRRCYLYQLSLEVFIHEGIHDLLLLLLICKYVYLTLLMTASLRIASHTLLYQQIFLDIAPLVHFCDVLHVVIVVAQIIVATQFLWKRFNARKVHTERLEFYCPIWITNITFLIIMFIFK